jgi:tRNA-specific 2-thiouridylase
MFIEDKEFTSTVKLRYRSALTKCDVKIDGDEACIILKEPAYGVASGQIAVFYDGDRVVGSGIITQTF